MAWRCYSLFPQWAPPSPYTFTHFVIYRIIGGLAVGPGNSITDVYV